MEIPSALMELLKSEGEEKEIIILSQIIEWHDISFIKEKNIASLQSMFTVEGLLFLQLSLFRSKSLLKAYLNSYEIQNPLVAALVTRAHFETTGGLGYLFKRIESMRNGNITTETLVESVQRLLRGVKVKSIENNSIDLFKEPINVMTLIDSTDDFFSKFQNGTKDKIFRNCYDSLSEICHPNCYGLSVGYDIEDGGKITFVDEFDEITLEQYHFSHFGISLGVFQHFYDKISMYLQNNNQLR